MTTETTSCENKNTNTRGTKVLCFGEIMLRLRATGGGRLLQNNTLEALFGGSEANVAVSLAMMGAEAAYCTVLPDNALGDACLRALRSFGVDISPAVRGRGRMGLYFVETGAGHLPGQVIYDREGSACALAGPGDIDWKKAAEGCGWLHLSGITPAISQSAAELTFEAARTAKELGMTVSVDLNYRKNLWKYGAAPAEVLDRLCRYADYLVANDTHVREVLGISVPGDFDAFEPDPGIFRDLGMKILERYPGMKGVALTLRRTHSADWNDIAGYYAGRDCFFASPRYEIRDIVDRIGGGDAFTAGLIYGLCRFGDPGRALNFGVAASCLKHSVPGDFNLVTAAEIEKLASGGNGRLDR